MMMKKKKQLTEAQLAQRRANAAAQKAKGKKAFVTVSLERDAKGLIKNYVANQKNEVKTLSEAVRKRFSAT